MLTMNNIRDILKEAQVKFVEKWKDMLTTTRLADRLQIWNWLIWKLEPSFPSSPSPGEKNLFNIVAVVMIMLHRAGRPLVLNFGSCT